MKLSDYVAQYFLNLGIQHVFVVTGGACLHIIDSISKTEGIDYVCTHHEQAAAMAADSYARTTGNIGAAVATSGPGATNLITGICAAYYDSIPVLYVTGQVSTFRSKDGFDVRQIGFQETEIVPICKTITKYVVRVDDPSQIRYELEKATYLAKEGRPGPVVVDIPDNLQREEIDPEILKPFDPREYHAADATDIDEESLDQLVQLLNDAERPVLVVGWGVRLSNAIDEVKELIDRLGIPVLLTWAMNDLLPHDHPLNVGSFGTHGTRYGNFTVQNSDLVLSIGSRLDTHTTGSPIKDFARDAKLVIVDIDPGEVDKFNKLGRRPHISFKADAGHFIQSLNRRQIQPSNRLQNWFEKISLWQNQFPICPEEFFSDELVNPYVFFHHLSDVSSEGDLFLSDTGCTIAWMMQSFRYKSGQR